MKWPWVSRSLADERLETTRRLSALLYAERLRFDALMEKYAVLKLAGAVPEVIPAAAVPVVPLPPKQEDELKTLIYEVTGKDLRRRGIMLKQLAADRVAGVSDEKIAAAIQHGTSSDGVPT